MCTIQNNGPAINPSAQNAIRNAAANCGVSAVVATHVDQTDDNHIFDIYDEEENYLFSIDTDGDVIFEK